MLSDPVDTLSSYRLDKLSSAFGELHVSYAHVDPFPGGKQRQVQRSKILHFPVFYEEVQDHWGYYICVYVCVYIDIHMYVRSHTVPHPLQLPVHICSSTTTTF